MTRKILVIDSSPRTASLSRKFTKDIADKLAGQHAGATITHRDLAAKPLPHLTEETINAYYTPADKRSEPLKKAIALSDAAVEELKAADVIVIGAPMWNFNIPSGLKAWIDHVVRAGVTFAYGANGPQGLMTGKKAIVVVTSGGVYSKGPMQAMDFQANYLKSVLGFIGITDVSIVRAEGVSMGDAALSQAVAAAEAQVSAALQSAA